MLMKQRLSVPIARRNHPRQWLPREQRSLPSQRQWTRRQSGRSGGNSSFTRCLALSLLLVQPPVMAQQTRFQLGKTWRSEVIRVLGQPDLTVTTKTQIVDYYKTLYQQCWQYVYGLPSIVLQRYQVTSCPRRMP